MRFSRFPIRLSSVILAALLALSASASAQVIVYDCNLHAESGINLDFYNGAYFVVSPLGGQGSFIFTKKNKGVKKFTRTGTGTLFRGATDGSNKWVVRATNTIGGADDVNASILGIGSVTKSARFIGPGFDIETDIAPSLSGRAMASSSEDNDPSSIKTGFTGIFGWHMKYWEKFTKSSNKKGYSITETLDELETLLLSQGYTNENSIVIPVVINTSSPLTSGTVGTPYSFTFTANGGTAPYTWILNSGSFPLGLTLSSGTLSGTPTTTGTSNFTMRVTDSTGTPQSATKSFTLAVVAAASQPVVIKSTSPLPQGTVGTEYSFTFTAEGGTAPYTWSTSSGNIPEGLTLSSGILSGTPTAAGTSEFTLLVTDSTGTPQSTTKPFTLEVLDAAP